MSLSLRLGTIVLAAATLFVASLAPARAETTLNEQQSLDGIIVTHPTTGEQIQLSGTAHLVLGFTQNANGAHLRVSINYQGVTGLGLVTGTQYTFHSNDRDKANVADDIFPGVFSFVRTARFVSQGADLNVALRQTFRATFNNNGTQTVEITRNEVIITGDGDNDN